MAGWKTSDMLSGIDGIMNLAAASGEDLASTSDIVTDALTAFGMTAADSAHFADILAIASSNSNTNVAMMGETFKYAAPMMGAMGYSAEDAAIAIGMMANSGIKASSAGTALRAGLVNLAKPTQQMQDAMDKYGISLTDASGQMLPFRDLIAELREKLGGLSEVEQTAAAGAIFGKNALSGWLAIINGADSDLDKLTNAIDNCQGATQEMANTRLDNLNGDLTLMDSAWQGLQTTIGEKFQPVLREAVQTGTEIIGVIDKFIQENPGVVEGITAFIGVVGAATAAVTAFNAVSKIAAALTAATVLPAAPIMAGVAAIAAATGAIVAYTAAADDNVPSVKELTEASRDLENGMEDAQDAFDQTASDIQATAGVADMYVDELERLQDAHGDIKPGTEAWDDWQQTLQLLVNTVPELSDKIDLQTGEIEGGTAALRENIDAWEDQAKAAAWQEYLNEVMGGYTTAMKEVFKNQGKLKDNELRLNEARKKAEEAQKKYNDALEDGKNGVHHSASEFAQMEKAIREANNEVTDLETEQRNLTTAIEDGQGALAEAKGEIDTAREAYEELSGAEDDAAQKGFLVSDSASIIDSALQNNTANLQALSEAYTESYQAAKDAIEGQYGLFDQADEIIPASLEDINTALDSQIGYWNDLNGAIEILRERAGDFDNLKEHLGDWIAEAENGNPKYAGAIITMANTSDENLGKIDSKLGDLETAQDDLAQNTAALSTDFDKSMDDMVQSVVDSVDGMNLSTEAAKAAEDTFGSYIKGLQNQYPLLETEINKWNNMISKAVQPKLTAPKVSSPNFANPTAKLPGIPKNASGTEKAKPGWTLVGERGPELIFLNGNESPASAMERISTIRESERISQALTNNQQTSTLKELTQIREADRLVQKLNESRTSENAREIERFFENNLTERLERIAPDIHVPDITIPGTQVNVAGAQVNVPENPLTSIYNAGNVAVGAPELPGIPGVSTQVNVPGASVNLTEGDVSPQVNVPGTQISIPDLSAQVNVAGAQVNVPELSIPDIRIPDLSVPGVSTQVSIPPTVFPEIPESVVNVAGNSFTAGDVSLPEISVAGSDIRLAPSFNSSVSTPDVNVPGAEVPEIQLPDLMQSPVSIPEIPAAILNAELPPIPDVSLPGLPSTVVPEIIDRTQGPVIVGQDGPELVYLQGGEKILNASQTNLLQRELQRESVYQFASGTSAAPAGYALVGERGPELISNSDYYRDIERERVMMASAEPAPAVQAVQPASMMTSYGDSKVEITVAPTYNISGQSDLKQTLEQHTMDLRAQIENIVRDLQEDQRRRAYL